MNNEVRISGNTYLKMEVHHKLFSRDNSFDPRFNAYLRCEGFINNLYQQIMDDYIKDDIFIGRIFDCCSELHTSTNTNIAITTISTGLSAADRNYFIDRLEIQLHAQLQVFPLSINATQCESAFDALNLLVDSWYLSSLKSTGGKRRGSAFGRQKRLDLSSSVNPIVKLEQLYNVGNTSLSGDGAGAGDRGGAGTGAVPLFLIIRQAESIRTQVFEDLFSILSESKLRVLVVLVQSPESSLCHHLSEPVRTHVVNSTVITTLSPFELYDSVMGSLLAAREAPVSIPAEAIAWIHESFWRSHMCSRTSLSKFLLCLAAHFSRRSSLLSMFEDTRWLAEMKIVKSASTRDGNSPGVQQRNVDAILSYLRSDDLDGCGFNITAVRGQISAESSVLVHQSISESIQRAHVDLLWFRSLLSIRDAFISKQRTEFPADMLFAEMISGSGVSGCPLLSRFLDVVDQGIQHAPFCKVVQCVKLVTSTLVAARSQSFISALTEELQDLGYLLDEAISVFQEHSVDAHVCCAELRSVNDPSLRDRNESRIYTNAAVDLSLLVSLVTNIEADLVACLRDNMKKYLQLPSQIHFSKVLELSSDDVLLAARLSDGNCRYVFTSALLNPSAVLESTSLFSPPLQCTEFIPSESKPDISHFFDQMMSSTGAGHIYDLFDNFQERVSLWKEVKRSKKKLSESSDLIPPDSTSAGSEQKRCRFVTTLNDSVACGLVSVQSSGQVVRRIPYTWIAETIE